MATKTLNTRFIFRNDTEALWEANNPILAKGEIGIATDVNKFKIGDDTRRWNELPYAAMTSEEIADLIDVNRNGIYEVSVPEGLNVVTDSETIDLWIANTYGTGNYTLKQGDICIVTDSQTTHTYYAAYVYRGADWVVMSGNVSADNVILTKDILAAGSYTQVGNITKTSTGTTTIDAEGKTLSELLTAIFTKEEQPTVTANPEVTLTFSQAGSYEVGTSVTPEYSASLSAGSYKYGPATGITATGWTVTNSVDGDSNTKTTATGSFDSITVGDSTNYKITAVASHDAGAVAVTNIGNASSPTIQIASGTKSKTSSAITGYRKPFWGYKLTADALADPTAITSEQVRALQKSGTSTGGLPTSYTVPADTKQIYFLAKAGTKNSITVKNASALNAPVAFAKVASGVQVEGANGYSATAYDLWYANFDAGTSGSANLTITWA